MKINLRQEVALWVLGLPWSVVAFIGIASQTDGERDLQSVIAVVALSLVSLVPIFLIIFSLRSREKPDRSSKD
jgi:hypothetical protein